MVRGRQALGCVERSLYKSTNGFTAPYGDYDAIAITNLGKSVAVMGEGADFTNGPGNIWFNRQT